MKFTTSDPMPATLLCDFYKVSHREQYPPGTEVVYSTWIPRTSKLKGVDRVVAFGFQAFIKRYLIDYFNEHFFSRPIDEVVDEYSYYLRNTLGTAPAIQHLRELHALGYLPLRIRAVPEGTLVPIRVPMLTIENTDPRAFWLTNFIETLFSAETWMPCTSATIAQRYRRLLDRYARLTGGDPEAVPFQGHDFSMRGHTSLQSAAASAAGHLLSFSGTDTIPGIFYAERYYGADLEKGVIGTSIPATEHSVMCAYGQDELSSYRRFITEVYPSGFVSIVSDTWDLWSVVTGVIPALRDEILKRDGRVVIRPDSGDPVKIICGDPDADNEPARKGVIGCLWDTFGGTITPTGYRQLDPHIGAIYGDAITLERCEAICAGLAAKGYASTNMVYGIGSFSYQYQTRDTFGFALKSTSVTVSGREVPIFKDPATDTSHTKRSLRGRVVVIRNERGKLVAVDGLNSAEQDTYASSDLLEDVFVDGYLVREESFEDIRARTNGIRDREFVAAASA